MMSLNSEFIGIHAQIIDSTNKQLVGLNGKIVNETQSMFTINTNNGAKMIPKRHSSWKFANEQVINGDLIAKRPEDRIKVKA
ncbi:MAG: ribonuclease P protein subunit [Nitrososphaeria archaeon]|nr:ribonuclease P protein subunit [Nitrosopumilaceae archaeon]NDF28898.1 ribonuclease P protein subunit [Nitrososphaeria archaeon]NDF47085.1 ribonuclease P protein subunit [Nitrosopumilaceae archaeon]